MKKMLLSLIFSSISTSAFCDEMAVDRKLSTLFPDALVASGEDGNRLGGICPFRKDSPAFHFEPAEQGVLFLPLGEFNSSSIGGFSFIRKKPQPILEGPHAVVQGGYGSFGTAHGSALASYGAKTASIMAGYGYRRADVAEVGGGGFGGDVYPVTYDARYRNDTRDGLAYESNSGYLRLNLRPYDPLLSELQSPNLQRSSATPAVCLNQFSQI